MITGDGPVLVMAPHPDDEVLGPGGMVARLADEGRAVYVTVVTHADPSIFPNYSLEAGRAEAVRADEVLGVRKTFFLEGFPAALLDTVPQSSLNAAVQEVIHQVEPEILLIPFPGDLHQDHRKVAEACMVAVRPNLETPVPVVWAYETLSETHWNAPPAPQFRPTAYMDISRHLERKLSAMAEYATQVKPFPHERSLEALRSLATSRGATVGLPAAEAFHVIRQIYPR